MRGLSVVLLVLVLVCVSLCRVPGGEDTGESVSGREVWSLVLTSALHLRDVERVITEEWNGTVLSGKESSRYGHLPEDLVIFSWEGEHEGHTVRESVRESLRERIDSHPFVAHVQLEENRVRTTKRIIPTITSQVKRMTERMGHEMRERISEGMDKGKTFRLSQRVRMTVNEEERSETVRDAGQSLFSDPLYADQWHLLNTGQSEGKEGIDVNVLGAWERDITGEGIQILIVDDGLQRLHPDIEENFVLESSFSFSDSSHDPTPIPTESHGTSCAGVAAAVASNGVCGVGVAFDASLAGIEILGVTSADVDEAAALTYDLAHNMIYSNSWGPVDTGDTLEAPGPRTQSALAQGVATGRDGKGAIYVWAAGNGLEANDNVNYDGFANSIETIAVGAVNHYGRQSYYSEPGAPMVVTAPSSGTDLGISTTDLTSSAGSDPGDCTATFGGTSSATPLVAGTIALMLQANPELGWRDVQHLLINTARVVDVNDQDWLYNGAGLHVNHKYGFGLVDATAAVEMAMLWTPLPREAETAEQSQRTATALPDGTGEAVEVSFRIDEDVGPLEHVQLQLTAEHRRASDLEVTLRSPQGTESVLAEDHGYDLVAQLSTGVETDVGVWAQFSAPCPEEGISGRVMAASPSDGCGSLTGDYEGAIVLMERGTCDFIAKSFHAQDAGAAAALIYDNTEEAPFAMAGSDPHVWLPTAMISQADGSNLISTLAELDGNDFMEGTLANVTSKPLSDPYDGWTFMSVRHWGEDGRGTWTLSVEDKFSTVSGTLTAASIKLYGSGREGEVQGGSGSSPSLSSEEPGSPTRDSSGGSSLASSREESSDGGQETSAKLWEDLFIVASALLGASVCLLVAAVAVAGAGLAAFKYRQHRQASYDIAYELKELEQSDSSALLEEEQDGDPDLNPLHA